MKRDSHVTVTGTSRVTSRYMCHVTSGVTQRVSHATTTTPHHTMSLVTASCGVCDSGSHPSHRNLGLELLPQSTHDRPRTRPHMDDTYGALGCGC